MKQFKNLFLDDELENWADENSIINHEDTQDINDNSSSSDQAEKKKSWVAKILHEKNEAKRVAQTAYEERDAFKAELDKANERISALEADKQKQQLENIFVSNPRLREHEQDIKDAMQNHNMDLQKAATYVSALHWYNSQWEVVWNLRTPDKVIINSETIKNNPNEAAKALYW